ncbi:GPI-anchored wall transfer protein 1 [Golovinomyces cichoracearum]|uniref:GPI-anchored wall transfer protein n=1 Tax=Golovinomyces cichoracearum TaxID=62708 RepID=A0A420I000_9PEZI|nr:GPI-anchored wall transfer protein 1 [Golovinomyces cichoracearum]
MSHAAKEALAANYKTLKEEFVSNLTGGSISEINYVTAIAPVSAIVWSVLQSRHELFNSSRSVWICVLDFFINVLTVLLATTLYSSRPILLNLLLLAPVLILYILPPSRGQTKTTKAARLVKRAYKGKVGNVTNDDLNPLPKRPFLTTYRGSMLVITSLSILAIDFRIFPRRFAKVETWGTSLMDVGVGSFVFSSGIVAVRPSLSAHKADVGLKKKLLNAFRHSIPLLGLGFIRLWSVKGLDYAEHVSEYGVHWNFFFTLGLLPPFVTLFQSAFVHIPSYAALSILLGTAYQVVLDNTNLKTFMLTSPRTNLLSKNREGLISFIGYLSIFLAGHEMGIYVLPRRLLPEKFSALQQRKRLLVVLGAWSVAWTLLFVGSTNRQYGLNLTVSRRLANLPYILWTAAFNTCQLTAFCLVETLFFPSIWNESNCLTRADEEALYRNATSGILNAFNRNGLAIFLLANILTGAVNLSVPTLNCSDLVAMIILVTYGALITVIAIVLDWLDISIKL